MFLFIRHWRRNKGQEQETKRVRACLSDRTKKKPQKGRKIVFFVLFFRCTRNFNWFFPTASNVVSLFFFSMMIEIENTICVIQLYDVKHDWRCDNLTTFRRHSLFIHTYGTTMYAIAYVLMNWRHCLNRNYIIYVFMDKQDEQWNEMKLASADAWKNKVSMKKIYVYIIPECHIQHTKT